VTDLQSAVLLSSAGAPPHRGGHPMHATFLQAGGELRTKCKQRGAGARCDAIRALGVAIGGCGS
jgi:hypothetical protein